MRVLFLDIDGVLNTSRTKNPRKLPYVAEKRLVGRLRAIVKRTRCHVVLISTWRYDPAGLFSARHHRIPFTDVTPDLPKRPRRDEINRWLKAHSKASRIAVLDDDDDDLDAFPLFQPDPRDGLTSALARNLSAYLEGRSDADCRRSAPIRLARRILNAATGHKG